MPLLIKFWILLALVALLMINTHVLVTKSDGAAKKAAALVVALQLPVLAAVTWAIVG